MRRDRAVRTVAVLGAIFFCGLGLWAFLAPRSFFERIADWPPYNRHLLHDVGAFQVGLGVALLAALRWRDSLVAALMAVASASVLHVVSHLEDRGLGGRPTDPLSLGLLAAVLIVAAVWRLRTAS